MSKVYLSLPITGYDIEERKLKAKELKASLEKRFDEVVTPFDEWEAGHTWSWYMVRCLEKLSQCDAIWLADGWIKSDGCYMEYEYARYHNIRIYKLRRDNKL